MRGIGSYAEAIDILLKKAEEVTRNFTAESTAGEYGILAGITTAIAELSKALKVEMDAFDAEMSIEEQMHEEGGHQLFEDSKIY